MRINSIDKNIVPELSFQGYKRNKDDLGNRVYEFNFPYDEENYDCYLEVFEVKEDKNGNYKVVDILPNLDTQDGIFKLSKGLNVVNLSNSYSINKDTPFAYHYKLLHKNGVNPAYYVDAGEVIDNRKNKGEHEIYNLVTQKGSNLSHGGSMKLVVLDNFNAGYVYNPKLFAGKYILEDDSILKKAMKSNKHFSNKIGGTMAGLERALDDGKLDGYSSIISLPIFTDDSLSPHAYWNKNCMQMALSLGNINNYTSLKKKMFAKGMNFVSDGAFVNEGLEGVHFKNMLKWGEKSPYFNWFKAQGLKSGPLTLGVFGKGQEFISHKIVNSPYDYVQNEDGIVSIRRNKEYDKKRPTYIQIFDTRLASDSQIKDKKNLIKSYDILNTDNPYEINTHNDTVINYSFEINPETYNDNIKRLNEYNKHHDYIIRMNDINGTRFLGKFENFELEEKFESGFETWDANADIAKLNYTGSHAVTEELKNYIGDEKLEKAEDLTRDNIAVQDYAVTSGVYWTQKTKDILTLHTAQNLRKINDDPQKAFKQIQKKIDEGVFPKRLEYNFNEDIVKNILDGQYKSDRKFYDYPFKEQVKMGLMNFPLDAIELGDNIVGVLATPYISKRASHEDEIGVSRYDLYKKGNPHLTNEYKRGYENTQNLYDNEMSAFALDILERVQKHLSKEQKLSDDNNISLYGKYVLPMLTAEIAKFAVIKAVQPEAKVYVNKADGEIGYDYEALKDVHLQTLGIYGSSPEDEALSLISKIRSGISAIKDSDKELLADALVKSLKDTNVHSFALADMIVDRSQSGLDWRIDAIKDIADVEALRNESTDFNYTWQKITDFWKKFTNKILETNPNAYIVSELTDEYDLHKIGNGKLSKRYTDDLDARQKLLRESGLTALANYRYFFTNITKIFGKQFEKGGGMEFAVDEELPKQIHNIMIGKEDNYLKSSDLNSLLYSYTFISNHDKPRPLHCFAMDMDQFFADLNDENNYRYRERAYRIIKDRLFDGDGNRLTAEEVNNFDYSSVSPKAIAMADTMIRGFGDTLKELAKNKKDFRDNQSKIYTAVAKSISDLANGQFLNKTFSADAFGVKPFDIVIDTIITQAQAKYGLSLEEKQIKELKNAVFETILEPAFSKLYGAMSFLVGLPGKPTLFSGDDLGATGYEDKTKNIHLQNRNYIHNEWLDDGNKGFIKNYYDKLNNLMAMRSRVELDALNNGAPFTLPLQKAFENGRATSISAILRQNTDGKMAISLFNTAGMSHMPNEKFEPEKHQIYLNNNCIVLDENNNTNNIGIKGGLKTGTKFVNANNSNDIYKVFKENDRYVLKHEDGSPICISDALTVLYHVPEVNNKVAFTGRINYKPQTQFVVNAYASACS